MNPLNHTSHQIASYGLECVKAHCRDKSIAFVESKKSDPASKLIKYWMQNKQHMIPCFISTKPHTRILSIPCTGMNNDRLRRIEEKLKKAGWRDAWFVFVDAKERFIYKQLYSTLKNQYTDAHLTFPYQQQYQAQTITYWSLKQFSYMSRLDSIETTELLRLHEENGSVKNQISLFNKSNQNKP